MFWKTWGCSEISICTSNYLKKLTAAEYSWKMRSAKCAGDCSESSFCQTSRSKNWRMLSSGKSSLLSVLRKCWLTWRDALALRACNLLWQNALARLRAVKRWWCCDAPAMWDCSWSLLTGLYELHEEKNWVAEAMAAQRRSSWEKGLLSEGVAQWRKKSSSTIHLFSQSFLLIHSSVHPFMYWFVDSWMHWFIGSLIHWFIDSLLHWSSDSLIHPSTDSSIRRLTHPPCHWFVDSQVHPCVGFIDSWMHDRIVESLIYWIMVSSFHWFVGLLLIWFSESMPIHGFIRSLYFSHSLIYWFTG